MIEIIGGKIILHCVGGERVAIDINCTSIDEVGSMCVINECHRVTESFDEILEAIVVYKQKEKITYSGVTVNPINTFDPRLGSQ